MQFDGNRNLFGCKNGVYDIEADTFRPYKFDDFVTMNCGYDYEELREGKRSRELTQDDVNKFLFESNCISLSTINVFAAFIIYSHSKGLHNDFTNTSLILLSNRMNLSLTLPLY